MLITEYVKTDEHKKALEAVTQFAELPEAKSAEIRAQILVEAQSASGAHVQWLTEWRAARDAACESEDGTPDEEVHFEIAEFLSIKLATIPATTPADTLAQIAWFKEDLGDHVFNNRATEHDKIFDTLLKSVQNISG
jgi:hypothetical protein